MALAKHHKINLDTLKRAFRHDAVTVMECRRKSDGKIVAMLCAVSWDGKEHHMAPFAEMVDCNPFEAYDPPNPDGGFYDTPRCTCDEGGSAGCPMHDEAAKGN